jgi:predicted esterase YcpF (UPF0227 family)
MKRCFDASSARQARDGTMRAAVVCLHGFNSGPASVKARKLERGIAALDPSSGPAYFAPQPQHFEAEIPSILRFCLTPQTR